MAMHLADEGAILSSLGSSGSLSQAGAQAATLPVDPTSLLPVGSDPSNRYEISKLPFKWDQSVLFWQIPNNRANSKVRSISVVHRDATDLGD
jgi:hypothetical protein